MKAHSQHREDEPAWEIGDCLNEQKNPFIVNHLYETCRALEKSSGGLIIPGRPFFPADKWRIGKMVEIETRVPGIRLGPWHAGTPGVLGGIGKIMIRPDLIMDSKRDAGAVVSAAKGNHRERDS